MLAAKSGGGMIGDCKLLSAVDLLYIYILPKFKNETSLTMTKLVTYFI